MKDRNGFFSKVFRDPVHDLIRIDTQDAYILSFIETREFQRLRRIRQLGVGYLTYPGAEHSRFAHSLGVFNVAKRMIDGLSCRHPNETLASKARIIKAAALLHDIGHGPLSHVWERVFEDEQDLDHEQWSCKILLDESTEIHARLLEKQIDVREIVSLICDRPPKGIDPPKEPFLKDIVHGQLDADRMDYLMRDSLMTGSRYGTFDFEWILNVLTLGDMLSDTSRVKKLCLDPTKGIGAIERMLHARLLMTQYVYGHKTTRAYEAELINVLRIALELADQLPDETPTPVRTALEQRGRLDTKAYLLLDDEVLWWALRRWAVWEPPPSFPNKAPAEALTRHCLRLVRREKPWKTVRLKDSTMIRQATNLYKRISADEENPLRYECYLDTMQTWPYKEPARAVRGGADPEEAYFEDIYVLGVNGHAVPILEGVESPVLNSLAERWVERRFHYDRRFEGEFAGLFNEFGISLE